jgi:hypothetical protein
MAEQSRGRRRSAVVAATAAALGASLVGLASATDAAQAAATCTVQFTSSDASPAVGQNITLRWTSSGADELVASWTTAHVPASGTQVTTRNAPGPASYQVTGLKSGQYCGGAVVTVVFTTAGAASSSAPTPTTSTAPTPSTATTSASTATAPSSSAAPTASPSATFPAQSPTGGSATPWYEQPANLLILGVLCLIGSIALFNRGRVHALLVQRH